MIDKKVQKNLEDIYGSKYMIAENFQDGIYTVKDINTYDVNIGLNGDNTVVQKIGLILENVEKPIILSKSNFNNLFDANDDVNGIIGKSVKVFTMSYNINGNIKMGFVFKYA